MPLKTKPTTRMERRLLKQVAELKKNNGIQAMKLLGATRDKNEALTKLREDLRLEAAVQLQGMERDIRKDIQTDTERNIRSRVEEERVNATVLGALMDAADRKRALVVSLRAEYDRLGIPENSVVAIHEKAILRLEEMACALGNA